MTAIKDFSGFTTRRPELFVNGRWERPHSRLISAVVSANTQKTVGLAPQGDSSDVGAAVAAARAAVDAPDGWAHWTSHERALALRRFADALDARAHEIAALVSDQTGVPITVAEAGDSRHPGRLLRYYAELLDGAPSRSEDEPGTEDSRMLLRRMPLGVVAAVLPWNSPSTTAALTYAPALAAGCTVVLKPSPEAVLAAFHVAEASQEAGLPPGVLNIVPGGRSTGAHLVAHPDVDKVAFTGSTPAGRQVGEVCGRLLRPVTLDLGTRSAALFLDDADLDPGRVGPRLAPALFGDSGLTRALTSRVLAPRGRYEEVVETVATLARSLRVGSSLDRRTEVGPLVSERQRERVEEYIERGISSTARLMAGGSRPPGARYGWFVEPTVFADVDPSDPVVREEMVGPVVSVTPYEDDGEAVATANDSEYALAGTVWTTDQERGVEMARHLGPGPVGINRRPPDVMSPTAMLGTAGAGAVFGPGTLSSYQSCQATYV